MNIMKEAHKMAKEIKVQYPEVDYKFQLGLCISYLSENKGEVEMVELKGSEKQIKWAEELRRKQVEKILATNYKHKEKIAELQCKLDRAEAIISQRDMFEDEEDFENFMSNLNARIEKRMNK